MNFKSMLNLIFVIIGIVLINAHCRSSYDSLDQNTELALLLALKPDVFQVEANLTDSSGNPLSNAMVYSQESSTSGTTASVRGTRATSSSNEVTATEDTFETSAETDDSGKVTFTIDVGDHVLIITTSDNKSYEVSINVAAAEGFAYSGTVTPTSEGSVKLVIINITPLSKGTALPKPVAFVCGVNTKGGDTAPPKITKIKVGDSPTISSGGSDSSVPIRIEAEDGYEGESRPQTGVKSIVARLYSPNKVSGTGGTSVGTVLSLNSESGMYEGNATIKSYMENGEWVLGSITASDKVNSRTYKYNSSVSSTNFSFYGCGRYVDSKMPLPKITVEGNNPDTTPPSIDAIGTATYTVDAGTTNIATDGSTSVDITGESPVDIDITVSATIRDNDGGSGIRYAGAWLYSPSRWNGNSYKGNSVYVRLSNTSGDTYEGTGTIKQYAENGEWIVGGFWISDNAGNGKWYGRDSSSNPTNYKYYVSGQGSTSTSLTITKFTLAGAKATDQADFYAPVLNSLEITKDSEDSLNFTVTMKAEDTGADELTEGTTLDTTKIAGIVSQKVTLYSPLKLIDPNTGNDPIVISSWTKSGDGKSETTYTGTGSFDSANEGGTWKAAIVELSDDGGNYRRYTIEDGSAVYVYPYTTESGDTVTTEYKESEVEVGTVEKN